MQLSKFDWFLVGLTIAGGIAQAGLVVLLFRRKAYSRLPIFLTYSIFSVVTVAVGMTAYFLAVNFYASCQQFQIVYWVLSFLFIGLEFGVMYEIFANVLRPFTAIVDLGKMVFGWATVFLLIVTTLTAVTTSGPESGRFLAAFSVAERSMRLMECGLLLLFFFFEKRLSIPWRNVNIAVAFGLGISGAVDLLTSYFKGHFSSRSPQFDAINISIHLGVVLFWSYCLSVRQPECRNVLDSPNRLIFQRWNEALAGYGYGTAGSPSTVESFLPGIEKTVDRVMARRVS